MITAVVALTAACSHEPTTVAVRGVVVHHYGGCAFDVASRWDGKTVVVRDASAKIVGTATTHDGTCQQNPNPTTIEQIDGNVTIVSARFSATVETRSRIIPSPG